jgi:hypothetical protein
VLFGRKVKTTPSIYLNGQSIPWQSKVKHLGNILSYNLDESFDVSLKRGDLASRVNKILGSFTGVNDRVKLKMFESQCCHFYGATAWRLTDKNVGQFHTMYNRSIRRILQLPPRTHTRFLPPLSGRSNSLDEIVARFVKMMLSAMESDNPLICYIVNHGQNSALSLIGNNIEFVKTHYCIRLKDFQVYDFRKHYLKRLSVDDQYTIKAVIDMVKMDNFATFMNFYFIFV